MHTTTDLIECVLFLETLGGFLVLQEDSVFLVRFLFTCFLFFYLVFAIGFIVYVCSVSCSVHLFRFFFFF